MNQHKIQESWLKQFQSRARKVEVIDVQTLDSKLRKPKEIASTDDFQSREHEIEDARIETDAIRFLHRLKKGFHELDDTHRDILDKWTALHISRSPRSLQDIDNSPVKYDQARSAFLREDLSLVKSFSSIWIYRLNQHDEPLILSDTTMLQLDENALIFPFTPHLVVMFTHLDPRGLKIEGRSLSQFINEMSFRSAFKEVYSNPELKLPWKEIQARARQNISTVYRLSTIQVTAKKGLD